MSSADNALLAVVSVRLFSPAWFAPASSCIAMSLLPRNEALRWRSARRVPFMSCTDSFGEVVEAWVKTFSQFDAERKVL